MASIEQQENGNWIIRFRFPVNGKVRKFNRSLKTQSEKTALQKHALIEQTIDMINTGRIALPDGATEKNVATFILSGGKLTVRPQAIKSVLLEDLWMEYRSDYSTGKEENSVATEETHKKNLVKILGNISIQSITTDMLQNYVNKRSLQKGIRGKTIQSATIKKELQTFRALWTTAEKKGYVKGSHPTDGVALPKANENPPFRTIEQIEHRIQSGDLNEHQIKAEWSNLFLREKEIMDLLEFVKKNAINDFIYPAFAFAAYTGARRSEIMRSEIHDFDFKQKKVTIRQKKRETDKNMTFREVVLHPTLAQIMRKWFKNHPGSKYTIVTPPSMSHRRIRSDKPQPLSADQMQDHFTRTLEGSEWEMLRGWHVLRHSFASNCARQGLREAVIDSWMGHSPDSKIKKRYQHLFPEDNQSAMEKLFQ
ncbi:site-specific integrase [Gimesia sp.]|uniref:tyrosine-type recombinase/integrase n=1 Tax=Gimesia sp. TaxID=2024833 RepID=UPI0032F075CC